MRSRMPWNRCTRPTALHNPRMWRRKRSARWRTDCLGRFASRMTHRPVARRSGARGSPAGLSAAPQWVCITSLPMCSVAYQLPHAGTHSALLPQVAAFNAPAAPGPFSRAARALGSSGPEAVGPALFELASQLRAPTSLADLGLEADAIEAVALIVSGSPVSNPRGFTKEDVYYLVQQAYLGNKP